MSISSIAGTALSSLLSATQSAQSGQGKFQQRCTGEFQQPGQDLQAGNLKKAQQDYATLSQNFPTAQTGTTNAATPTATAANSNPIARAFAAVSTGLQNGKITAAQQDYATIQQDSQQQGSSQVHHHHHHGGGGQQANQVSQALNSLSSALQSGNLSSAQTAFATLQQDLEQFSAGGASGSTTGTSSSSSQANGSGLNVTA
jgi:outer membrane protein assembly factor BamD (BamD/ComL family)